MMRRLLMVGGVAASILVGHSAASAAEQTNITSSEATRLLRNACQYLAEASFFAIKAEVWRDHVDESGQKVQFSRLLDMEIKRPDRLHVEIKSGHTDREFWFDGKALSVLDRKQNFYSSAPMSGNLDFAIDNSSAEFGIDLPLVDLALSDPYANATAKIQSARYFGKSPAMGYSCDHLAFTQENVDWQIWIDDGPQPLIRKFVITHKNEPGSPEFTGLIRSWDMNNRIADSTFAFVPPRGAVKVEMQKEVAAETGQESNKPAAPEPTGR